MVWAGPVYVGARSGRPSPAAQEDAVILEARGQVGERRGLDRLVDLDRAQEAVPSIAKR